MVTKKQMFILKCYKSRIETVRVCMFVYNEGWLTSMKHRMFLCDVKRRSNGPLLIQYGVSYL